MRYILISLLAAGWTTLAFADGQDCEGYVWPPRLGDHQTVERMSPGLLERITTLQRDLDFTRPSQPRYELMRFLKLFSRDVERIRADFSHDPRLTELLRALRERIDSCERRWPRPLFSRFDGDLRHLQATVFELSVGVRLPVTELHANRRLRAIHNLEMAAERRRLSSEAFYRLNREIDLAGQRSDGRWIWVEAKNWGTWANERADLHAKLEEQAHAHKAARDALGLPVELWLVTAHPLPERVRARVRGDYDRIFTFQEYSDAVARGL